MGRYLPALIGDAVDLVSAALYRLVQLVGHEDSRLFLALREVLRGGLPADHLLGHSVHVRLPLSAESPDKLRNRGNRECLVCRFKADHAALITSSCARVAYISAKMLSSCACGQTALCTERPQRPVQQTPRLYEARVVFMAELLLNPMEDMAENQA
jgi:hypothetical protein